MTARFKFTAISILLCIMIIAYLVLLIDASTPTAGAPQVIGENQMKTFSSMHELEGILGARQRGNYSWVLNWNVPQLLNGLGFRSMAGIDTFSAAESDSGGQSYSETNIQVAGVDEADIVKTDGQYIYCLTDKYVYIVDAYPSSEAEVVSRIELEGNPVDLFVSGDRLVVYKYDGVDYGYFDAYYFPSSYNIDILVYDITDRADPVLNRDVSTGGSYVSSRMVGDYVYTIVNKHAYDEEGHIELPEIEIGDDVILVPVTDIYYPSIEDAGYGFTTIVAINIADDDVDPSYSTMLLGSAGVVYMSINNIYVSMQSYMSRSQVTQIHRFAVSEGMISYQAAGEAPGWLLNQFSMDEHNGYFRVATTTDGPSEIDGWTTKNNVYVLNMNMDVVGKVEDLAPGERIYSTRFLGDRGYMVTFRQVDPLFAIDLSDPVNPQVMGELKITGYSDYMHPYDEDHLIGIGKEATEEGRFLGMKIALFDVSDISNPVQVDVYEIGDRGTESPVLRDHKAFLFDREHNLMAIPLLLAEINDGSSDWWRGQYVWQGAYVFDISPETGIELRGGITHYDDGFDAEAYWSSGMLNSIKRTLYIDDVLYTVSDGKMKMNDLDTLDYINEVELWNGTD